MIVVPVIERELRAVARQALTYNLRVVGVLALVGVLVVFWIGGNAGPGMGGKLFGEFHATLFFAIWCLVPFLTADCISRERREGTLALLFLTRLSRIDLVYAKGLAHGLRSLTLWLGALPVFTICFLAGGVGWPEVIISALVNFSSICLALGAGLIASCRTRLWTRALAGSAAVGFLFFFCFLGLLPWTLEMSPATLKLAMRLPADEPGALFENGLAMAIDDQGLWQQGLSWLGTGPQLLVRSYAAAAVLSLGALYLLFRFSAWNLDRSWQERPASTRILWLRERFFKPLVFRKQLRAWLRWQLQRNPVGWLEQRSWSGRLVVWSWFAIVACVYSSLFAHLSLYQRSFHLLQSTLGMLLAGSIAVAAASSFRRERETGVLELLLVAPLREWQIIAGRLRGLWVQFLPAIALLLVVWLYGATFLSATSELPSVLSYALTFATLPVVGLYFSLVRTNFIAALIWTLLVQMVIPAVGLILLGIDQFPEPSVWTNFWIQSSVQLALAAVFGWRLLVLLKNRAFVTE
jgi:ABC-type transport system involved in multi-copper enzyme maturation permease subunit